MEFSKSLTQRNLYSKPFNGSISYSAYLNSSSSFIISHTVPLQPFLVSPPLFSVIIFCFTRWDGRFYFPQLFLVPYALPELGHSLLKSWGLLSLPLNLGRIWWVPHEENEAEAAVWPSDAGLWEVIRLLAPAAFSFQGCSALEPRHLGGSSYMATCRGHVAEF